MLVYTVLRVIVCCNTSSVDPSVVRRDTSQYFTGRLNPSPSRNVAEVVTTHQFIVSLSIVYGKLIL